MDIILILGARPQIIKSAPLIRLASKDKETQLSIIHTGQHYDYEMTKIFFKELHMPDPIANLNAGSGTHSQQTAKIIIRLEKILIKQKPNLVIVPGDTNSTLAGALTASKIQIPVAHIEAGARSYDIKMPEEINRRLTDHCSTLLFAPTKNCARNLKKENIEKKHIHQTGDTMYDVLLQQLPKAEKTSILQKLNLIAKNYALLTIHRPENVDNPENLKKIVKAITKLKNLKIVFPAHPRTRKRLAKYGLNEKLRKQKHVKLMKPIGYHETINLIKSAKLVITDSGGMQKEAFWLHTPCITLRENTEWPETFIKRANQLTGSNVERILEAVNKISGTNETKLRKLPQLFGHGKASENILQIIKNSEVGNQ